MFERLNTPQEALNFKLGATLKMEKTVLEILDDSIESAQDDRVKDLLRSHRSESERHVANVEAAFGLLDWEVDDSPCPAIEGLQKEGKAMVKKTDDSLVDSVILQAALEVEHHELGVYENLIINVKGIDRDRDDVARLLHQNFESEQEALDKVRALQAEVAGVTPKPAA
jgi:ferritin-like metal-binding protein YciE